MCKHCKPTNATPAAEAGMTPRQIIAGLVEFIRHLDQEAGYAGTDESLTTLECPLEDYEPAVATGVTALREALALLATPEEESRTRNPEPAYRYFASRFNDYVWRMPPTGVGEIRTGPDQPWLDSMWNLEEMLALPNSHPETPNPDLSTN